MDSEELKPCPFCGSIALLFDSDGESFASCINTRCGAEGCLVVGDKEEAVKRWNRRVHDDGVNSHIDDVALEHLTKSLEYYRAGLEQREPKWVPSRVRLKTDVRVDPPFGAQLIAYAGEHDCDADRYGAIRVIASNGEWACVRPRDFDPLEWRENEVAK